MRQVRCLEPVEYGADPPGIKTRSVGKADSGQGPALAEPVLPGRGKGEPARRLRTAPPPRRRGPEARRRPLSPFRHRGTRGPAPALQAPSHQPPWGESRLRLGPTGLPVPSSVKSGSSQRPPWLRIRPEGRFDEGLGEAKPRLEGGDPCLEHRHFQLLATSRQAPSAPAGDVGPPRDVRDVNLFIRVGLVLQYLRLDLQFLDLLGLDLQVLL